jgi:hypothetical protein
MGVANEYDWDGDADVDIATLRAFVAAATGGEQLPDDGVVYRDGLYVMGGTVSGDEVNPALALFGLDQRFRLTFRFHNLAEPETTEHNTALMTHTLIAFAQRHGGQGVLLFNGERAVLQYGAEGVVFDSDWEDWAENPETAPLLTQFPSRVLDQPLL